MRKENHCKEKGKKLSSLQFASMEVQMEHFFPEILITDWLPFRQAFSSAGWRYFQGNISGLLLGYGRDSQKRLKWGGVSGSKNRDPSRECVFLRR